MLTSYPTPYYAVIFTSLRRNDDPEYGNTNDELEVLAKEIKGFLGTESVRESFDTLGISISYWDSMEAIQNWREHAQHRMAKEKGIQDWYKAYSIRIAKVEYDNFFQRN